MNKFIQKPDGRRARKDATRERLLAQARARFVEHGYEGTTIRSVAKACGIAVGTVFVHFPDKGALLAATLDDQLNEVLERARAALPRSGAKRRIRHVLGALLRSYAQRPALSRVLLKETLFVEGRQRAAMREKVEAFVSLLEGWCEEPGALRPGLSARGAAEAVFAAYLAALLDGLGAERPSAARMLAQVERLTAPWFNSKRGEDE